MVLETWCLVLEFFHKQRFKHKLMQKNSPQIKEAPPTQLHPLVHIQSFCVQNTDGHTDPLMTSLSESLLEVNSYKVDQRDATRPKRRRKANWAQNKVQQGVEHPATRRETWPHTRAHIHPEQTQIRAAETNCTNSRDSMSAVVCLHQSEWLAPAWDRRGCFLQAWARRLCSYHPSKLPQYKCSRSADERCLKDTFREQMFLSASLH